MNETGSNSAQNEAQINCNSTGASGETSCSEGNQKKPIDDSSAVTSIDSYVGSVRTTVNWIGSWVSWYSAKPSDVEVPTSPTPVETPPVLVSADNPLSLSANEIEEVSDWFEGPVVTSKLGQSPPASDSEKQDSIGSSPVGNATVSLASIPNFAVSKLTSLGSVAIETAHSGVANALIAGIRVVSSERDRDEIIRWFVQARGILADKSSTAEKATALYNSTDTIRFSQLLANTVGTSIYNYYGSNWPLALKIAIPVTVVGAGFLGMQGAGVTAFGTGIGMPVVLLLFLGTAGVTTVLEAFTKDRTVRDPLTKLLLMFVSFENARRVKKELLDAMRADAMVPSRTEIPSDIDDVLAFLLQMDPVIFECHIMSFFEQDGHPTGLTPRSNDFGVDGYVFHPDGIIVVQCKRYGIDNPVGRPAIQQFKGVIEEQKAFKGYFVTTSRFTEEAVESALKTDRICLINGADLVRWHKEGRKAV